MSTNKTETPIVNEIRAYLERLGYHVEKTWGNAREAVGRPDLSGYQKNSGYAIKVEVKYPGRRCTQEQMDELQLLNRSLFGIASCCTDVKFVLETMTCPHCNSTAYGDFCFYCNESKILPLPKRRKKNTLIEKWRLRNGGLTHDSETEKACLCNDFGKGNEKTD